MMTDPVSDMLIRIKNGLANNAKTVNVPFSKFKESILTVLKSENYIEDYQIKSIDEKQNFVIRLRYFGSKPAISHLKRISKPGLRVYTNYQKIPRPLQGIGIIVISTPQGVITGKEAWGKRIGGELICEVH